MLSSETKAVLLINPIDLAPNDLDYNQVRCDTHKSIWWATDRKGNAGYARSLYIDAVQNRTSLMPVDTEGKPLVKSCRGGMPYRVEAIRLWDLKPDDIALMGSGKTDDLQNQAWLFATWQGTYAGTANDFYKNPWIEVVWLREIKSETEKEVDHGIPASP